MPVRYVSVLVCCTCVTVVALTLVAGFKVRSARNDFQISEDVFERAVYMSVSNYLAAAYARQNAIAEEMQKRDQERRSERPSLADSVRCRNIPFSYWRTPAGRVRVSLAGSEMGIGDFCEYGVLVRANEFSLLFRGLDGSMFVVRNTSVIPGPDERGDRGARTREQESDLGALPRVRAHGRARRILGYKCHISTRLRGMAIHVNRKGESKNHGLDKIKT